MRLNELKDNPGSRKMRVRIGRGIGSGMGKMGGRGGKGQTARSGVAIGGFEGGQMPLYRRLPKRGFTPHGGKTEFALVNLRDLAARFPADSVVDPDALAAKGLIKKAGRRAVKV